MRRRGLFVLVAAALVASASAADVARLGALGDSLTDEYAEEGYGAYARSWTELLVEERGVEMGLTAAAAGQPGGSWGEPRRTGFEDNWARFGITTDGSIAAGAPAGLAAGVATRGVSHAVLFLGGNDFSPWAGAYDEIYGGVWGAAEIDAWLDSRIDNYRTILDLLAAEEAPVIVASVIDFGAMPFVRSSFPNGAGREAVAAALADFRDRTRALAGEYGHPFLDLYALSRAIFGSQLAPRETLPVGNVPIDLDLSSGSAGDAAAWVADAIHPHTVVQAIWANAFATALDSALGGCIAPLSESEILAANGLAYGGADTLAAILGPLSGYLSRQAADGTIFRDEFECGSTVAWSGAP
jgi:hypothetical protein